MPRRPHRAPRKTIRKCPECGSIHVIFEAGLITGQRYHCLDCNYVGSFIVEEDLPDEGSDRSSPP
jgi:ssDNA-binding Zn-finger/Zn-ribbon topoisomerase 1